MNSLKHSFAALALLAVVSTHSVLAQEIPPKPLLDVTASASAERVVTSSKQVTVTSSADANAPGLVVTIEPGADAFPGVRLTPPNADAWDFSNYGHIEARLTNTGSEPLRVNVRVDNLRTETDPSPWNTEVATIAPGKRATAVVIFGYQFGHSPGYALKPDKITAALVFVGKSDKVQSFRIESVQAGGPPGEKPSNSDKSARIKPKGGILLGQGVTVNAAKQIEGKTGAQATADGNALVVNFPDAVAPATGPAQSLAYKPATGKWHLGDAFEVRVRLKNTGAQAVTPSVQIDSDMEATRIVAGDLLAPGAEQEIVVPFAAAVSWQGVPAAERKGSHDSVKGTGTQFASDKTNAVRLFAARESGAAQLRVESIVATSSRTIVADWVGQRPPVAGEWTKTFEDNFETATMDLTKWNIEGPNHWDKVSHWSKQNVILGDGLVRLRAERKTGFHNDDPKQKQTDQACGYLDTFDKFRQRYGYFEARMKLPTAPGLWPAFWMMPDRGSDFVGDKPGSKAKRCSTSNSAMEFDIMETLTIWGPHRYNVAMHWDDYGPTHKAIGSGKIYVQPDKDGFITCGLLWLPGQAVYYANGIEVARWEDARVSSVHGYMIFTMPVGGWDGNASDGTGFPDDFVIDYVRVWQRNDLQADTTASATK